jgi:serine/threonine-protein kinase RsbW
MNNQTLKIACKLDNLRNIREYIASFCASKRLSEIELNNIVLAIDEICANLMIHSNKCDENKELELKLIEETDGLKFEILDQGKAYDTTKYITPDLNHYVKTAKKGGLGMMIVKKVMDSVEFSEKNGKNICCMFKRV